MLSHLFTNAPIEGRLNANLNVFIDRYLSRSLFGISISIRKFNLLQPPPRRWYLPIQMTQWPASPCRLAEVRIFTSNKPDPIIKVSKLWVIDTKVEGRRLIRINLWLLCVVVVLAKSCYLLLHHHKNINTTATPVTVKAFHKLISHPQLWVFDRSNLAQVVNKFFRRRMNL